MPAINHSEQAKKSGGRRKTALLAGCAFGALLMIGGCEGMGLFDRDSKTEAEQTSDEYASGDSSLEEIILVSARKHRRMADMAAPAPMGFTGGIALPQSMPGDIDRERYEDHEQNPVMITVDDPVSTFSVDVDTASYSVMRRYLNDGVLPPRDSVRVEELINYFDYDYELPKDESQPFKINTWLYETPWNAGTQLLHIGIKGYDIVRDERPDSNLVLLLDVSGSMNSPDKLPLLKKAMRLLVDQMGKDDTISIVVYAGAAGTVLEPTKGSDKSKIMGALDRLHAGGSTAGGEGIRQAYALAQANFKKGAVNRVMLATDGDFNVGISDPERLEDFISEKRDTGVFLTVLGFGRGNYNDALMQTLAQAGNGNAAYIDSVKEARKVLVDEMGGTLFTIAKDVKIQVQFNPARIAEYRLIGYETRMLEREDFKNDKVDAGDIGSGHSVTAIYEIVPVGSDARLTEPLRYGKATEALEGSKALKGSKEGEVAFIRVRHKLPDEDVSHLIEAPVLASSLAGSFALLPQDIRFASAVAAFGQELKGGTYTGTLGLEGILALAQGAKGDDEFGYRAEFVQLVRAALSAQPLPGLQNDAGRGD